MSDGREGSNPSADTTCGSKLPVCCRMCLSGKGFEPRLRAQRKQRCQWHLCSWASETSSANGIRAPGKRASDTFSARMGSACANPRAERDLPVLGKSRQIPPPTPHAAANFQFAAACVYQARDLNPDMDSSARKMCQLWEHVLFSNPIMLCGN